MSEKFSVEWNDHQSAWRKSLSELRAKDDFADVTLVTEDKKKFSAHKILISSCSKTLKFILKDHIHSNPLLYLSGINSENLGFILDYIYCGEVKLFHEQLEEFLESARKLEIEGLFSLDEDGKHLDQQKNDDPLEDFEELPETPSSLGDDQYKEPKDIKHEIKQECKTPSTSRKSFPRGPPKDPAVFNASSMTAEELKMKRKELYQKVDGALECLACDYATKDRSNIKKHIDKHIEGLSYTCRVCSKEFPTKTAQLSHMKKDHKK